MPQVLVLGAGINGAALARELVLHGLDVVLIDRCDLGSGTTAYSSRLIHGGLRYLEYGDTALVRESLEERDRLLRLASDFVRPLEFRVPTESRLGGAIGSATKLLCGRAWGKPRSRGAWLVGCGLRWYGRLSRESKLPAPRSFSRSVLGEQGLAARYRFLSSYYDAQMRFPERFVVAMVDDARTAARDRGVDFRLHTYANVAIDGEAIVVTDDDMRAPPAEYRPDAVVNAAGPWGDHALRLLGANESRLIAGTKGTHFVTYREDLRASLCGAALYVEASDGRPVFILPFGSGTLVGTTDLPFECDPATAVATENEIGYLLGLVNGALPSVRLARSDVLMHYAGVRPLPRSTAATTAAVSRRHAIVAQAGMPWPVWTLVGGKLTTCRALAEETSRTVMHHFGRSGEPVSRERPIPDRRLSTPDDGIERPQVGDSLWKRQHVRQIIRNEFVRRLEDLVERRLMLHFAPELSRATLDDLASLLVEEGLLDVAECGPTIARCIRRLHEHFGRAIDDA